MKISQINQINYANFIKGFSIANNTAIRKSVSFQALNCDIFVPQNKKEQEVLKRVFDSTKKFSIRDYKKLHGKKLETVRKACILDTYAYMAALDNVHNALKLKPYLDKKYGKDKYVFCSIGRSSVGLARVFEFMGVETKYIPISGLRNFPDFDCFIGGADGFKDYGKFLKKQGISNEKISLSDKSYLFYDYTVSGKTLSFFKDLITKYYGIRQPNMHFLSLNDDLYNIQGNEKEVRQAFDYIDYYLSRSNIENYSGISELRVWRLYDINNCQNPESDEAKKFNFLVIDLLNGKGLLKENSKNKKSL